MLNRVDSGSTIYTVVVGLTAEYLIANRRDAWA
jgi:hypothetical protein